MPPFCHLMLLKFMSLKFCIDSVLPLQPSIVSVFPVLPDLLPPKSLEFEIMAELLIVIAFSLVVPEPAVKPP